MQEVSMLGVIGGSGLYRMLRGGERIVKTDYGGAIATIAKSGGREIAFIARHGKRHEIPPHKVNYKANLKALQQLGADKVIGTYAAGIISRGIKPGELVLASDFAALSLGAVTFFDTFGKGVAHTDFTGPYDRGMRTALMNAARRTGVRLKEGRCVIATMPGPRFESKFEVQAWKKLGADMLSMTNAYETILAAELGLRYAAIAIGTNYACGIAKKPLSFEEVFGLVGKKEGDVRRLILAAAEEL